MEYSVVFKDYGHLYLSVQLQFDLTQSFTLKWMKQEKEFENRVQFYFELADSATQETV